MNRNANIVSMTRRNFDKTIESANRRKDDARRDISKARQGKIAEQMFWSISRLQELNGERGAVRN